MLLDCYKHVHLSNCTRFDHYARLYDVQTLAMLACVFQEHCLQFEHLSKKQPTTTATPTASSSGGHGNNNHMNRTAMGGSPPKKFHGQTPPTPTPSYPVPHEKSSWGGGNSVSATSPISGSWQEVSENDLMFHEGEDPLLEEQDIHEMKCK